MKKMMIAASVAAIAGVALAEGLTSGVVGYNNKGLVNGQQMVTASFVTPGVTTFRVSDLKIQGYQNDPTYIEEGGYSTTFFVLDSSGRCIYGQDTYFSYADTCDWDGEDYSTAVWSGGVWSNNGAEIVPGDENDLVLDAGDGLWFAGQASSEGFEQTLQTAGEVLANDYLYVLISGQNAVGNPTAAPVWVSDLLIDGYQNDPTWIEEGGYSANFFIMNASGLCNYEKDSYFAYSDGCEWDGEDYSTAVWSGGVWSNNGAEITAHGEDDYQLKPGEGIWFAGQDFSLGHEQSLIFPTALK